MLKKTSLEELLEQFNIQLTLDEKSFIRDKIIQEKQKFMDLVIWGEYYEDEEGNRIDPLTINKSI